MKKAASRDSTPRPYRQLIPVMVLLAINLAAYLYVMSVNLKDLNLITPTPKDISNLIIMGSYVLTTLAMLLALTSYFSLKAYIKRSKGENPATNKPELEVAEKEKKDKNVDVVDKKIIDKNVQSKIIAEETKAEPKMPEKSITSKRDPEKQSTESKEIAPQIHSTLGNNKNWKKIGIKIPDKPIEGNNGDKPGESKIAVDSPEASKEKLEEPNLKIKEDISEKNITLVTDVVDNKKKTPDQKIKTDSSKENLERPGNENDLVNPPIQAVQDDASLQPLMNSIETIPTKTESNVQESNPVELVEENYDSEIIKTLDELKQIVSDMKVTIKKKQQINSPK